MCIVLFYIYYEYIHPPLLANNFMRIHKFNLMAENQMWTQKKEWKWWKNTYRLWYKCDENDHSTDLSNAIIMKMLIAVD